MHKELFSDCFAQRENYLTQIDARIKLLSVIICLGLILCSRQWFLPLVIAIVCFGFLLNVKIPARIILFRLLAPLGATAVVFVLQFLFVGTTPLLRLQILDFTIVGYSEGLWQGIVIVSRVTGAVSLIISLSMTTPLNKLLTAAGYFKIPHTWIEIAMLTYRYIFVLLEDAIIIRDAQRARLGYSSILKSLRSIGELAGATVIKAYDHAILVQEAMSLRGAA